MPTYEYRCKACGHELEAFQKMSDPALRDCPACSKPELERLISGGAFHLKGGGWYRDSYSKKPGGERTEKQVTDRLQKAINEDKKKTNNGGAAA
jgi:putative FmdB family regulatory protein